jgi:SAM-dependent methyltransferase
VEDRRTNPAEPVSNRLGEYESRIVQRTLGAAGCPAAILEAREEQDARLARRIRGRFLAIADIGCGSGYHGSIFAPASRLYHGFEIAPELADRARARWRRDELDHAEIFVGDAADARLEDELYDVVLCLYFTAGNLRDPANDLSVYTDDYLDENPKFIRVVANFYEATKPGGSMFLTVYKDVPAAEQAQREFYEATGQHVVTPRGLRFVATKENFWSARWTKRSMLSNLAACAIGEDRVRFVDLNSIAWMVEIGK